jgi:hypothetical protein
MKKLVGLMCVIVVLAACKSGDDDDSTTMTGTGGTTGGAGMGSGTGGGGAGLSGACADADISAGGPALYAAAAAVLTPASPCGFMSCHVGTGKAKLVLMGSTDLKTLLVNVPSCEAPTVPLIDGSGNETALNNSWIWQKLTAMTDGTGTGKLVSNPAWGMNGACGQAGDQPFGMRMPATMTDMMLDVSKLTPLKAWICAGAPGPQ